MKIRKILKAGIAFLVFLFMGCSGGGSGGFTGDVETKDSSFLYNTTKTEISGYFTIGLDDVLPPNTTYIQKVELTNFTIDIGCGKISQSFGPENITFSDNKGQKITLTATLNGACNQNKFNVRAEKIITTTYANTGVAPQITVENWSKSFNIQNNYEETSSVLETKDIVLTPSSFTIKNPGEIKEIKVIALNSNKELLEKDLTISSVYSSDNTKDYGSLDKYELKTSKITTSTFSYTAPKNLADVSGKEATVSVTDPTSGLKSYIKINFSTNATSTGGNYVLRLDVPSKLSIDSEEYVSVKVVDKNNEQTIISQDNFNSIYGGKITLSISNSEMLQFKNGTTTTNTVTLLSGDETVLVKSLNKSGVTTISAKPRKGNEELFPITIISGPINSISLVYKETKAYSETAPLFSNIYTIHAVDKYANPANAGEKIYVGAVVGVTKSGNDYLYSDKGGSISKFGNRVIFKTDKAISGDLTSSSYKNVLIVLGNENNFNPDYTGGWDIEKINSSNNISLTTENINAINFSSVNGLSYVIGSEKRFNSCTQSVSVADIDSDNGIYSIDENGRVDIKLTYDPDLVGHTVFLYANTIPSDTTNLTENRKRVGVSINDFLVGLGIGSAEGLSVMGEENQTKAVSFSLTLKEAGSPLKDIRVSGITVSGPCEVINGQYYYNTGCTGTITTTVKFNKDGDCSLGWNGAIIKDYSKISLFSGDTPTYNFD